MVPWGAVITGAFLMTTSLWADWPRAATVSVIVVVVIAIVAVRPRLRLSTTRPSAAFLFVIDCIDWTPEENSFRRVRSAEFVLQRTSDCRSFWIVGAWARRINAKPICHLQACSGSRLMSGFGRENH